MHSPTPSIGGYSIDACVQAPTVIRFPTVLMVSENGDMRPWSSEQFFHQLATEVIEKRITHSNRCLKVFEQEVSHICFDNEVIRNTPWSVFVPETENDVKWLKRFIWQMAAERAKGVQELIPIKVILRDALEWKEGLSYPQYADECEKKSSNSIKWLIVALCVCLTVMKLKSSWSPKNLSKYKNIQRARGI